MISAQEHLSTQSFLRLVRTVKKVAEVAEAHISVLTLSVMFGLHMIFKEICVLKVFLALSTLVFTLRDPPLLENDYLFPERQELVLAEGALVAHADVVLGEDGKYLLVNSI